MSLIIEDGSGVALADSYVSVEQANAYHAKHGNAAWADMDYADKESALVRATDYMMQAYRARWKGFRSNLGQALDWPRQSVILTDMGINYMVPYTSIPEEVKKACAELALRAMTGGVATDLAPDQERGVLSESVTGVSITYDPRSPQAVRFRAIDMLLQPYLASFGAMTPLGRS